MDGRVDSVALGGAVMAFGVVRGCALVACAVLLSSCSLMAGGAGSGIDGAESGFAQSGAGVSDAVSAVNPLLASVTVSNLVDEGSRSLVRESLLAAGVPESDVDLFFSGVSAYNEATADPSLVAEGFVPLGSVDYNIGDMISAWEARYPNYVGQNCRLTSFQLAHSLMKSAPASPDTTALFIDKDALSSAPSALLPEDAVASFESVFGRVATSKSGDIGEHVAKMREYFAAQGVYFPDSLTVLSVVMHDTLDDTPYLFIGHVGIVVPSSDGDGFLFIEKLAFDEPYQVLKVKDVVQVSDVLMARYDIEYGQDNARPFVMANGNLVEGFRGNPNNVQQSQSDR